MLPMYNISGTDHHFNYLFEHTFYYHIKLHTHSFNFQNKIIKLSKFNKNDKTQKPTSNHYHQIIWLPSKISKIVGKYFQN